MLHARKMAGACWVLATFVVATLTPPAIAQNLVEPTEAKCAAATGKAAVKLVKTIGKEVGKCKDADISGKAPGACPTAKGQAKIDKAADKIGSTAAKKCTSVCSLSPQIPCIADNLCPPLASAPELCSAGAKAIRMDIRNLGFPGAFCQPLLGGPISGPGDLGNCIAGVTNAPADVLIDIVYGGLTNATPISSTAQKCLKTINKDVHKLVQTMYGGIHKCRQAINDGKVTGNPATCTTDDVKLAGKIAKAEGKLADDINGRCSPSDILELDLCLAGQGGVPDQATAISCLLEAVQEIVESPIAPTLRTYSPISLVEANYPPARGVCGDNIANQLPNSFQLYGEECDGTDDSACPGECKPPGDFYECTCGNRPLMRFVADGLTADLDNGWTGTSHNSGVTDGAGWIADVSGCDCDAMSGMECTGSGSDVICDLAGQQLPFCSFDTVGSTTSCDARNTITPNGVSEDGDCQVCDQFNLNAGDYCNNESHCQAQCYPEDGGAATGLCTTQGDCGAGEVCRGQCDKSNTCIIVPNGHPLPISSGGTAVCVKTTFRQDVTGTLNLVTGEQSMGIFQFSKVHLGVSNTVPCPICGGFCDDDSFLAGDMCTGTCSTTTTTRCRFDSDCPGGETCTTASPDCPGGACVLSLVCNGGPNDGEACRIGAQTTLFGTTSVDCPPNPGQNISGNGLVINFNPQTSEVVSLPATLPCTATGFENYDCQCPSNPPGTATKPNRCAAACDAGANVGSGCANADNPQSLGVFTSCVGGSQDTKACDEDADCPGGTCSNNPNDCSGDPLFDDLPCDPSPTCVGGPPGTCSNNGAAPPCLTNGDCINVDCGGGTLLGLGVCGDACPGGRCVPHCSPGLGGDAEEGFCTAGPSFYHCDGAADTFRVCSAGEAEGGCSAVCAASCNAVGVPSGGSGAPCDSDTPCGGGEICCGQCKQSQFCQAGFDDILGNDDDFPGAGKCIADDRNCFVQPIIAEGGDTLNGNGDPNNARVVSTYCIGPTGNSAINNTAGLGGPGRLRQNGVNVNNGFTSLP